MINEIDEEFWLSKYRQHNPDVRRATLCQYDRDKCFSQQYQILATEGYNRNENLIYIYCGGFRLFSFLKSFVNFIKLTDNIVQE